MISQSDRVWLVIPRVTWSHRASGRTLVLREAGSTEPFIGTFGAKIGEKHTLIEQPHRDVPGTL